MKTRIAGCLLLWLVAVAPAGVGQFNVGLQAPLALVGGFSWGSIGLEAGVPLRFELDALGAFAELQWRWEGWLLDDVALWPFIGAGAELSLAALEKPAWFGSLGVQMNVPQEGVWVFAQLALWPGVERGLPERVTIGLRLEL